MKTTKQHMTARQEYEIAIHVQCPFCGAVAGQRCEGDVFPQFPHLERLDKALN